MAYTIKEIREHNEIAGTMERFFPSSFQDKNKVTKSCNCKFDPARMKGSTINKCTICRFNRNRCEKYGGKREAHEP